MIIFHVTSKSSKKPTHFPTSKVVTDILNYKAAAVISWRAMSPY
jgi:hypothetical protein